LVIPYPAGGGVDTVGRIIAQKLTVALGQQVVVENRPGAGSVIGTRAAVKAPPDGYTLLMITTGLSLSANPGYDVTKDFAPIGTIASIPIVVMANASVPVKTLSDVIALAKKEPGKVTIGSPPPPTLNYFGAEQFKAMTGIDASIVTYKGTGPLTNDLVGGHVMLAFNTLPRRSAISRPASSTPSRSARPSGSPPSRRADRGRGRAAGLDVVLYYGLAAPAGTPRPIIERLNKELRAIVTSDEFKKRIIADGGGPAPARPMSTPPTSSARRASGTR